MIPAPDHEGDAGNDPVRSADDAGASSVSVMSWVAGLVLAIMPLIALGDATRTEEADDAMVLAFFDTLLAPQRALAERERVGCLAIGDNPGHHDPERHILKTLRKRYPWTRAASTCDRASAVLSVGPFRREGNAIVGWAGEESSAGRCLYRATQVAVGLWRLEPLPCVLE
jgi:hypothetical protein